MKAIVIHGGAGSLKNKDKNRIREGLNRALEAGFKALLNGKGSTFACIEAVSVMEDDPIFNAGTGSALTLDGRCEMDASIMQGWNLKIGAVAGVEHIKNPIKLAYKVLTETDHVLLVGEGAEKFARSMGFEFYNPITEERKKQWLKLKEKILKKGTSGITYKKIRKLIQEHPELLKGTVGCVALDEKGHIVAGTSTGGVFMKLLGRVGDTPIPGAGTYATHLAGASATGIGEGIMRVLLSKMVTDLIGIGLSPKKAAEAGIDFIDNSVKLPAGVIALNRKGDLGFAYNTEFMPGAYLKEGLPTPLFFGLD